MSVEKALDESLKLVSESRVGTYSLFRIWLSDSLVSVHFRQLIVVVNTSLWVLT